MESSNSESFDYAGAYRDAFFTCSRALMPRTEIPRWNTDAIREHKATCPKCIEIAQKRAEEKQLQNEGPLRIQYCIRVIEKAHDDIDHYERLKSEVQEKKERGEEPPDGLELEKLRLAEYDAGVGRSIIEKEKIELDKLLNHENEIIREAARKEHKRYEKYLNRITNKHKIKKKEKEKWVT